MSTAEDWITAVAHELDTDDRQLALRVLQSWLFMLRKRITAEAADHFAADLPDSLRCVFDGPAKTQPVKAEPVKDSAKAYTIRFGRAARIPVQDVGSAAAATTAAVRCLLPPAKVHEVLDELSVEIRLLINPESRRDPLSVGVLGRPVHGDRLGA